MSLLSISLIMLLIALSIFFNFRERHHKKMRALLARCREIAPEKIRLLYNTALDQLAPAHLCAVGKVDVLIKVAVALLATECSRREITRTPEAAKFLHRIERALGVLVRQYPKGQNTPQTLEAMREELRGMHKTGANPAVSQEEQKAAVRDIVQLAMIYQRGYHR